MNHNGFTRSSDGEWNVQNGVGSRSHGECLCRGGKAGRGNGQAVETDGRQRQLERPFAVGRAVQREVRIGSLKRDLRLAIGRC